MKHSSVKAIIAVCLLGTLFCSSSCKESYENKIRRYESEGKTIINNLPFYEDHFHIVFKDNDKFFLDAGILTKEEFDAKKKQLLDL